MKSKETEPDEYNNSVFETECGFDSRFRRLEGDELTALRKRVAGAAGQKKSRVTIYFDSDVVRRFKELSEKEGVGYQTLMNQVLRKFVDGQNGENVLSDIKNDLLNDKKFLKRLKTVISS